MRKSSRMAPKEKQTIEIEKTDRDPLLSFNQAVTVDCSDFLGTALFLNEKAEHFCSVFGVSKSCPGSEVAGGHAALLQVLLVVLFGAIEGACGRDLRGDGPLEFPNGIKRCP